LYCLEPTFLAHSRIVHTDVAGAAAYFSVFLSLVRYLEYRNVRAAALLGLVSGLALLTKFSLLIIVPVLALISIGEFVSCKQNRRPVLKRWAMIATVTIVVINAGYFFQHPRLSEVDRIIAIAQSGELQGARVLEFVSRFSLLLPTYFLYGIYNVVIHNAQGHSAFLLGRFGTQGWWYYFPVSFALKTTLPFFLLSLLSIPWATYRVLRHRSRTHFMLLCALAVYLFLTMTSSINIGIRHLLPVFPFLFLLCADFLRELAHRGKRHGGILVSAVLVWNLAEVAYAYPNYMAYMNELRGSRPEWSYLSDSNVEWGDDVADLVRYMKSHDIRTIRCAATTTDLTLSRNGLSCLDPYTTDPHSSYVAIGAGFLNGSTVPVGPPGSGREFDKGRQNYFDKYRNRQPEAIFGRSLYLYPPDPVPQIEIDKQVVTAGGDSYKIRVVSLAGSKIVVSYSLNGGNPQEFMAQLGPDGSVKFDVGPETPRGTYRFLRFRLETDGIWFNTAKEIRVQ
jgi:hypothetical protein